VVLKKQATPQPLQCGTWLRHRNTPDCRT
jgi:hypothetical protein